MLVATTQKQINKAKTMKTLKYFLFFFVAILIASCSSSTRITSSWKAPEISKSFLEGKHVMVLALLPDEDRELQKLMEEKIVSELSAKGVNAISAFQIFGPKYFPTNETEALKRLNGAGTDAVLTVVLLDKDKQKNYTPGHVSIRPIGYYRSWYGYYRTVYSRVYSPGYYTTSTAFMWESNLYDLNDKNLLYSSQSKTFDPSSISMLSKDYSKVLVQDLTKHGLISN